MANELILRGVPASILKDSWWLADSPTPASESAGGGGRAHKPGRLARPPSPFSRVGFGLLGLILAADLLLWRTNPGLSLVIFAGLVFAVAAWLGPRKRGLAGPGGLLGLGALPAVEHVQALSLGFLAAGLIAALVLMRLPQGAGARAVGQGAAQLLRALPLSGLKRLRQVLPALPAQGAAQLGRGVDRARDIALGADQSRGAARLRQVARNWAFPLGGALVLSSLLIEANPVLERFAVDLFALDVDLAELTWRAMFWLGMGLMTYPLLVAPAPAPAASKPPRPSRLRLPGFGLNPGSVLRALVMFNALLAVQTLMDLTILLGGAELPEGMTYATYAHRGAYPLLATAMLAGAFALAARPFLGEHRALKPLVLLWLGQNVALGVTAMLRLNLYVGEYGLTYLRAHAAIWMGLVVIGLGLTAWQILRARSNGWLMARAAGLGVVTLYACCFVNFAAVIATTNLEMKARDMSYRLDVVYLCNLGPMADKAIGRALREHQVLADHLSERTCWRHDLPGSDDLREWDFRSARIRAYLLAEYEGKVPL